MSFGGVVRFSHCANLLLEQAQEVAMKTESFPVGTEHILFVLLIEPRGVIAQWLRDTAGYDLPQAEALVSQFLSPRSKMLGLSLTPTLERCLEVAAHLARKQQKQHHQLSHHIVVTAEIILCAILRVGVSEHPNLAAVVVLRKLCPEGKSFERDVRDAFLQEKLVLYDCEDPLPAPVVTRKLGLHWSTDVAGEALPLPTNTKTTTSKPELVVLPPTTHTLIPNMAYCGASPSEGTARALVLDHGISVFVSLQSSYNEYGSVDYRRGILSLSPPLLKHRVRFLHCPIPDFGVVDDASLLALVQELVNLMQSGEIIYIHCYGGHGRTGSVATSLLSVWHGKDVHGALQHLKALHKERSSCRSRGCSLDAGELEAEAQEEQAHRLTPAMTREQKKK
eukprot:PhM_4_TR12291/c0_g1_i1/m.2314